MYTCFDTHAQPNHALHRDPYPGWRWKQSPCICGTREHNKESLHKHCCIRPLPRQNFTGKVRCVLCCAVLCCVLCCVVCSVCTNAVSACQGTHHSDPCFAMVSFFGFVAGTTSTTTMSTQTLWTGFGRRGRTLQRRGPFPTPFQSATDPCCCCCCCCCCWCWCCCCWRCCCCCCWRCG